MLTLYFQGYVFATVKKYENVFVDTHYDLKITFQLIDLGL